MNDENELSREQSAGLLMALADRIEKSPNDRGAVAAGFRVIAAELMRTCEDCGAQVVEPDGVTDADAGGV